MTSLTERIAKLSPEKRKLLLERLKKATGHAGRAEIARLDRAADSFPLSFAQQRLWFIDRMDPGNPAYNIATGLRIEGELDERALAGSLTEVVRRHESLRTTFSAKNGQPVQRIAAPEPFALAVVDLTSLAEAEREREADRLQVRERSRPLDLSTGPLLRVKLLRLGGKQHVLLLTTHHIISDAFSMDRLLRDLATCYQAMTLGKPADLPDLPLQYVDYAAWQRRWLEGDVLEEQLAYWRARLGTGLSALELPTARPRPAVQTFGGAAESITLSDRLSAEVVKLSRREGATLFMTLLAAFKVLLSRYSGQHDIVVGTPVANRDRRELEDVIGLFVNMLVLRTDLSGDPGFRQLLGRVREVALGAYAHQDLPFERLVEELRPARDLSRSPLFQVMFNMQPVNPLHGAEIGGLRLMPIRSNIPPAQFDLTLYASDKTDPIELAMVYNTDLFDGAAVARMLRHYEALLEGIVADPDKPIAELPLLTGTERRKLLVEWNRTERDYRRDACLSGLVEAQVERTPDSVAVECEGSRLTYRQLNARANQLARHLRGLGVQPEDLVAIYMDRCVETAVALLGVLKAGAAYLPLDPAFPQERIRRMLADAASPVIVTRQQQEHALPDCRARIVRLDRDWNEIAGCRDDNLGIHPNPDQLAYVIYTSGSTGKPKGVQIPHRAVVNFLASMAEEPGLNAGDTMMAVTTLAFDISVLEIFLPLTTGAKVHLAGRDTAADAKRLMAALSASGATVMQATPSTWRMLVEAGWQGEPRLKILCGGETMGRDLADALLPRCAALWNMYGPTETTVWSAVYPVEPGAGRVPIGRPIANTRFYVLDDRSRPVPVGVPGELYIGGEGLARGYRNRPELTAEKFVADPFSGRSGARLYRTGDLVRYLPDGNLEFLGRRDQQVKVRGFRIELGEIEDRLARHPAVRQVVVVVREDRPGNKQLAAYLVSGAEPPPTTSALRAFARETLPEYMVPSVFVFLEALPLMPNRKVDRKALPAPEASRPELEAAYVAPETVTERAIAAVWQSVLGIEKVGVDDNFFDLGGHSLLLVQVQNELYARLDREVSIIELFEYPTITALSSFLTRRDSQPTGLRKVQTLAKSREAAIQRQEQLMKEARKRDVHFD